MRITENQLRRIIREVVGDEIDEPIDSWEGSNLEPGEKLTQWSQFNLLKRGDQVIIPLVPDVQTVISIDGDAGTLNYMDPKSYQNLSSGNKRTYAKKYDLYNSIVLDDGNIAGSPVEFVGSAEPGSQKFAYGRGGPPVPARGGARAVGSRGPRPLPGGRGNR